MHERQVIKIMREKLIAFTLAEVLITLGIIGIVAAMTIPTLTKSYQKRITETKLQKFYSTMNQAIRLSTIDNGDTEQWQTLGVSGNYSQYSTNDLHNWFDKYLAKYIKYYKIEDSDSMQLGRRGMRVYLQGGGILEIPVFLYDMIYYPDEKCLSKGNCITGKDIFWFRFSPNPKICDTSVGNDKIKCEKDVRGYFETYSQTWDGTINGLKYNNLYGCYSASIEKIFCARLIQTNGWKFPSDYPW